MSTLRQIMMHVAREEGWRVTNGGEAALALALRRMGYGSHHVQSQFNLGPYHLDFALVAERIDIEADGWVHTTQDVRRRDRLRDRQLRDWGWTVIRIDLLRDVDEQLAGRLPAPSRLAEYGSTYERLWARIAVAEHAVQRHAGKGAAESLELVRQAVDRACTSVERQFRERRRNAQEVPVER